MAGTEEVFANSTTDAIRKVIADIKNWRDQFPANAKPREVAIVLTKLEEAELFSMRMVAE